MNNPNELLTTILNTLVKNYHCVEMEYNSKLGVIQYNLNTGFKSNIHLGIEDGKLVAHMRYSGREVINNVEDLLNIYTYWFYDAQGRGWGVVKVSPAWEELYKLADVMLPRKL